MVFEKARPSALGCCNHWIRTGERIIVAREGQARPHGDVLLQPPPCPSLFPRSTKPVQSAGIGTVYPCHSSTMPIRLFRCAQKPASKLGPHPQGWSCYMAARQHGRFAIARLDC
eukprot:scaffold88981_cov32-Tisochrysis_lutea.AAC.8